MTQQYQNIDRNAPLDKQPLAFGRNDPNFLQQYASLSGNKAGLPPATNRKNSGGVLNLNIPKMKDKSGLYPEDEDPETSMYFNQIKDVRGLMDQFPSSALYAYSNKRPDMDLGQSPSPSQLTSISNSIYGQPGLTSLGLGQRGLGGQRNTTPTTSGNMGGFPLSLQQQQSSPNRSIMSNTIGQRSFNQVPSSQSSLPNFSKRQNPLSSSGLFPSVSPYSATGRDTASLDMSEFPTLGNRLPSMPASSALNVRNYVSMVSKPTNEQPEFSIQQEDFPALPGANPPTSTTVGEMMKPNAGGLSGYEAVVKDGRLFNDSKSSSANPNKRTIQTHADGTVSNIPMGMVTDQFGMVGLLTFIKAAETDDKLAAFAPGIDLTTLGLNLNSPEHLYSTFQSPWADAPCRPQDIDYHVPSEYLTNIYIRDKLAPMKLNRYGEDLLFFLFCMNGGDVLQLAAAVELYNRDWRYHKEERVWITRAPGVEPPVQTSTYERGTYYYFDVQNWRRNAKEFHLEYDKLEDKPQLPMERPQPQHYTLPNHTIMGH